MNEQEYMGKSLEILDDIRSMVREMHASYRTVKALIAGNMTVIIVFVASLAGGGGT